MILNFIKEYKLYIIGAVVGAIGGYLYWRFIGCNTGECAITSSPINSSIWGAVFFALVFSLFKKTPKKDKKK